MTNYKSYQTPAVNELWYNSRSKCYYVGNEVGRLMPLQFDLSRNHPNELLPDIRRIRLIDGRAYIGGVCDGQAGWVFVADNWLKYVKQTIHKVIKTMSGTLEKCAAEVGGINEVC